MSNDNNTLADVQPGGTVRLGDEAERARFEAWGRTEGLPLARGKFGGYAFEVTARAWRAWQYLSAQPSPGGQGAPLSVAASACMQCTAEDLSRMLRDHVEKGDPRDVANFCMMLHQRGEAIAAHQPVGEQPMEMRICELRHVSLKPNRPYIFTVDANCANCRADAAYAMGHTDTRPAQAVDLGKIIEQIAQQWDGCNYDAVGETIDVGRALRAAGMRLIDSQAVRNG